MGGGVDDAPPPSRRAHADGSTPARVGLRRDETGLCLTDGFPGLGLNRIMGAIGHGGRAMDPHQGSRGHAEKATFVYVCDSCGRERSEKTNNPPEELTCTCGGTMRLPDD
jgi:hypothetical protein